MYLIVAVMYAATVNAIPPIATEIYGSISINGEPAPAGTNISVYDPDMVRCGFFVVKIRGIYGLLSCNGDDPDTPEDEGATTNDRLMFFVNDMPAETSEEVTWTEGSFHRVEVFLNLTRTAFEEMPKKAKTSSPIELFILIIAAVVMVILLLTIVISERIG